MGGSNLEVFKVFRVIGKGRIKLIFSRQFGVYGYAPLRYRMLISNEWLGEQVHHVSHLGDVLLRYEPRSAFFRPRLLAEAR